MTKKLILSICVVTVLFSPVFANENTEIDQKDMQEMNAYVEETENIDVEEEIEKQISNYISEMRKRAKKRASGKKIFISSIRSVSVGPENPDFVKALSIAYTRAFLSAQQEFVMDKFGRIISEKEQALSRDDSTNAREFESDKSDNKGTGAKLGRLLEKTLSLAEKTLDNALVDLGVDPEDIANATEKEKKTLMKDTLVMQTVEKAIGSVAGFVPIKSFVGKNNEGVYFVGVVGMRSSKTAAVAHAIATKHEPMMNGKGKAIEDIVTDDKVALQNEMGIRLVFDETGRPALISFGQWGFNAKGLDSRKRSRAKNSAKKMASSQADAMVSDFVNGAMVVTSTKDSGEIIEETLEREGGRNGMEIDKTVTSIVDKINDKAKLKSKMDKAGFETVKQWSAKNEHGHYVVGVIRKWTFEGLESAQEIINNKPTRNTRRERQKEKKTYKSSINESAEYDTVNDF